MGPERDFDEREHEAGGASTVIGAPISGPDWVAANLNETSARRRAWRLIRRHLIGEPQLMRILELYYLGVSDPKVMARVLGIAEARALSLKTELLDRLLAIRRAMQTRDNVRARFERLPWQRPTRKGGSPEKD